MELGEALKAPLSAQSTAMSRPQAMQGCCAVLPQRPQSQVQGAEGKQEQEARYSRIFMYVCVCVCIYIYIYVRIYIYIIFIYLSVQYVCANTCECSYEHIHTKYCYTSREVINCK